ncbi:MAG: hypothetical protein A3F10_04245 [Coxiella sp. RIFCSPHIGHO2_12_FULL_42_15]|nr:MAG: hypothetical protein A3F10_04245 [Coxiella sp. RIFCSPHIGHO2_12_FULL_42_15]
MKALRTMIVIATLLILVACSPVRIQPEAMYTMSRYALPSPPYQANSSLSILVTTPIAAPGYHTAKMIYMIKPFELQYFANNRWVAPPADLLLPVLTHALRNTHYFYAVASSPFSGFTDYRLDTQLLMLQQEFKLPHSRIHLVLVASLIQNKTNRVIATQTYNLIRPTVYDTPYEGVVTTTQTAHLIATDLAQFVVRNISHFHGGNP